MSLAQQGSFWSEDMVRRSDAPTIEVSQFKTYSLDVQALEQWLARAPKGAATDATTFFTHVVSPHA